MEQPAPVPVQPRPDRAAADMGTLEALGRVDEQPVPSPDPPPPPASD